MKTSKIIKIRLKSENLHPFKLEYPGLESAVCLTLAVTLNRAMRRNTRTM